MIPPLLKRIVRVVAFSPARIVIEFDDGRVVMADLSEVINRGGVFEKFRDERFFKRVRVGNGGRSIVWPHGIDFCADAFYLGQATIRDSEIVTNPFGARIFTPSAEVVATAATPQTALATVR
jgi:hypothetical protein